MSKDIDDREVVRPPESGDAGAASASPSVGSSGGAAPSRAGRKELAASTLRTAVQILLLAVAVGAVYSNALHGPFEFDDWHVIPQNPSVRGPANIPSFFTDPSTFSLLPGNRDYRPIFLSSMALCWWIGKGSTFPFHVVSIALHLACVILLFLVLRWMLRFGDDPLVARRTSRKDWAAFAAALLYAVHPLATEPVDYISSQSVLWVGFFYLLSFLLFLGVYHRAPETVPRGRDLRLAGSYLAYFAALLSKPIAVTLPLNLVLWELILGGPASRRRMDARPQWRRLGGRLPKHLPYVGVTALYLAIRALVFTRPFGSGGERGRSLMVHYLTQTKAMVLYYLKLAVLPLGQNADVEYPLSHSITEPAVLFSIAVLAAIAVLLLWHRRHRLVVFWSLWFPACLVVTTYLTVLGQVTNEHRAYLALAGFCAVVGLLGAKIWEALPLRIGDTQFGRRSGRIVLATLLVLAVAGFSTATRARNQVWSSGLSLWRDAASHDGTWRAHMNYALALEADGQIQPALAEYRRAVELGPYAWSYLNLGLAQVKQGQIDEGLKNLRESVRLWNTLPEAHLYLGFGLDKAGRFDEAETEMRKAIELRGNYLKAYELLGAFYQRRGRYEEALATYRRLHELDPGQTWVENRIRALEGQTAAAAAYDPARARQLLRDRDYAGAVRILEAGYRANPKDPELLFNLAFAHQRLGHREEAIRYYEELLAVEPDHKQGCFNLAYAYRDGTTRGEWSRAAILFRRVLQLDPGYTEALHHLATVLWKLGETREARESDSLYVARGGHADLIRISQERLKRP
jgi:tetratricopeptide (TPR) repeat protein